VSENTPRRPYLGLAYDQYLEDQDAAGFVRRVSSVYSQATLQRLAEHDAAPVRRAAVLALGLVGDYEANATLGRALQDEDRTVRTLAEHSIREVWPRVGTERERRTLSLIIRLNSAQQFEAAIRRATEMLERTAWLAEAWNQRAIAHFSLEHFEEAVRDCHQTLEINPYHFAAAAGMGQAYLKLGNPEAALESFRRALRLNPDLEAVRVQVARLARLIGDK